MMIQLVDLFAEKSCARTEVYPISSICSICRKIVSGLSFHLEIKIRNGSGSLHVMIAGSGKRPSILTLGGFSNISGICAEEPLRKRGLLSGGCVMLGEN